MSSKVLSQLKKPQAAIIFLTKYLKELISSELCTFPTLKNQKNVYGLVLLIVFKTIIIKVNIILSVYNIK